MKKEIAELWIKELRSGNWEQTTQTLKDEHGYCCLGVLCEIAAKEGICKKAVDDDDEETNLYDESETVLPVSVKVWAGMNSDCGKFGNDESNTLIYLNDDEDKTFPEIADAIEKYMEIL